MQPSLNNPTLTFSHFVPSAGHNKWKYRKSSGLSEADSSGWYFLFFLKSLQAKKSQGYWTGVVERFSSAFSNEFYEWSDKEQSVGWSSAHSVFSSDKASVIQSEELDLLLGEKKTMLVCLCFNMSSNLSPITEKSGASRDA